LTLKTIRSKLKEKINGGKMLKLMTLRESVTKEVFEIIREVLNCSINKISIHSSLKRDLRATDNHIRRIIWKLENRWHIIIFLERRIVEQVRDIVECLGDFFDFKPELKSGFMR
jgi:hypothetical protein